MALDTSYTSRSAGSPGGGSSASEEDEGKYWQLERLKRSVTDFFANKREELDEQITARRYYHGEQYTDEQLKTFQRRRQPAMTYNRISRKINAVVGQLERLKQDPKAYARTPQHEEGADLATAVLRFVLDDNEWNQIAPDSAFAGAVDGIGGVELNLKSGDKGDPNIEVHWVDPVAFFYDPRSKRADFSDARYMGSSRMMDEEEAQENTGVDDIIMDTGDELSSHSDWDNKWFSFDGKKKQVRVVELWYKHKGKWCWAIFTGAQLLKEGPSPFVNEDGESACKYSMFSGNVAQEGSRYGFVRNLKSPQDGINARQSKMQHILASKRIIVSQGAVQDIEKTRAEWARPDGVIVTNGPVNEGAKPDDQSFDFAGWSKMYEQSVAEIEQFAVNSAGMIEGEQGKSGRAIALLQQAGIAELGPYILAYRGWKVRVYRAIWNAVQKHWQAERYVRVTDDEGLAQYLAINKMEVDPMTGAPTLVNAIGNLDVDIILDEGPDTINAAQDVYETLQQVVPAIAPLLAPQQAGILVDMMIQNAPLDGSSKKKWRETSQALAEQGPPPDPEMQKAQMQLQIDAEKNAQDIQLEREKTQAQIQLEREKAEAEFALKQQQAEQDMQLQASQMQMQQQQHASDIQMQREKGETDLQISRQKADNDMEVNRAKASTDISLAQAKGETDRDIALLKNPEVSDRVDFMGKVQEEMAAAKKEMAEAMQAVSQLSDMVKQMAKPRKQRVNVRRDANNRIVGADVEEAA